MPTPFTHGKKLADFIDREIDSGADAVTLGRSDARKASRALRKRTFSWDSILPYVYVGAGALGGSGLLLWVEIAANR